jgi:hypothetical protein
MRAPLKSGPDCQTRKGSGACVNLPSLVFVVEYTLTGGADLVIIVVVGFCLKRIYTPIVNTIIVIANPGVKHHTPGGHLLGILIIIIYYIVECLFLLGLVLLLLDKWALSFFSSPGHLNYTNFIFN